MTTPTQHSRVYLQTALVAVLTLGLLFTYTLPAEAQYIESTDRTDIEQTDDADDNGDGDTDVDEEENVGYNNSRSNRATVIGDDNGDTDADGRADVSRQSDFNDPDDDGDDVSDGDEVTNRNESNLEFVRTRANITKEIDKASPHIRALRGIDKATPALYERIRTSGLLCPTEDCDDGDDEGSSATNTRQMHALRIEVSGDEVRGASEEAKAEVRARLEAADEANDANDFGIRVALAAIDNESIDDIESDDEETIIHYHAPVRIFGFIPAELRARVEATDDGERVRYPWYAFLVSKEDQSDLLELAAELRASHEAILSAAEEEGEEE